MEFLKRISVPPSSLEQPAQETQPPATTDLKEVRNLATDVIEQSSAPAFSEVINSGQESFDSSTITGGNESQTIDDPQVIGGSFDSSGLMHATDDLDAIANNQRADSFSELMNEIQTRIDGMPEPDKSKAQAAFNDLKNQLQALIAQANSGKTVYWENQYQDAINFIEGRPSSSQPADTIPPEVIQDLQQFLDSLQQTQTPQQPAADAGPDVAAPIDANAQPDLAPVDDAPPPPDEGVPADNNDPIPDDAPPPDDF